MRMKKLLCLMLFAGSMLIIGDAFATVEKQKTEEVVFKYENSHSGFDLDAVTLAVAAEPISFDRPLTNSVDLFYNEAKAEIVSLEVTPKANDPPSVLAADLSH
jgi:hypothetical protein